MLRRILQSRVIQADETPVQVLDPTRDSTRTGYFWAYIGDAENPYTVYDYRDSRGQEGPAQILKDFRGYLQTDAYSAYESVVAGIGGADHPGGLLGSCAAELLRRPAEPAARGALRAGADGPALRHRG